MILSSRQIEKLSTNTKKKQAEKNCASDHAWFAPWFFWLTGWLGSEETLGGGGGGPPLGDEAGSMLSGLDSGGLLPSDRVSLSPP